MERSNTLSEDVYHIIRSNIINGIWEMGKRLTEKELSEQIHVSRTPIRWALSRLYDEGLLYYHKNFGYRVRIITVDDIIEIYKILNYFRQHNSQTAKGNRNGRGLIESFEIIHAIEELFPKISWSKRHQCYGKFSRYMRRMLKDKDLFREVKVHYTENFGTSTVFIHYLYYKLCRHFRFLPWVLTEEKDRL